MKKTHKILGGIFIIFLILSTLGLGVRTEVLDHGTNSLIGFDEMENLTDRTLTINWGNNFSDYDPQGGDAEVVIAIYVPVDYGVNFTNNITLNWSNNNFQFEVNNVSDGNCTELNRMVVEEGGEAPWSTNCTLIVINGTLQNPQKDIGFNLTINITLSDACAGEGGICHNENYQLMFSDLITYEKEVTGAICDLSTYNNTGTGETYCYVNGSEVGAAGVNYSYCSMLENLCYSCAMPGEQSDTVTCNITKGIGGMYNETNMSIMDMGVPGGKLLTVPDVSYIIELVAGWNLISLSVIPDNQSIRSVLENVDYQSLWMWNTSKNAGVGGWETYTTSFGGTGTFSNMEPGRGYWINVNTAGNFTVTGSPGGSINTNVVTGWNLIGYTSREIKSIVNIVQPVDYQSLWMWNASKNAGAGGWETYTTSFGGTGTFSNMEPGRGYWINVNTAGNLEYTGT